MPKLTRDEMFQRAMAEFLQTFEVKLANGEIKTFHIQTYTLTNKTENKTKFEHEYIFYCVITKIDEYKFDVNTYPPDFEMTNRYRINYLQKWNDSRISDSRGTV